ncbi:hypothetical protein ACEUCL_19645 [Aeromonas dhakensis]|uniref:hypothetical protein n=1 Tax=Aeromonas dhakensis TaxID=196024 RepID=UPI0038D10EC9
MPPSKITGSEFFELQRMTYGFTATLLESALNLDKTLALGIVDEQAIQDIAAFKRAGHFTYDPEVIMPAWMTSGLGLPVRLIAYYDRTPVAYAMGAMSQKSIDVHYWEVSTVAPKEVHVHWVPVLLAALEDLSVSAASLSENEICIEQFAFTSPDRCDIIPFESAGFEFVENYDKSIPAVVTYRTTVTI